MSDALWYVIHTYSGYENKVASDLEKVVENRKMQDLIQEIIIPTEKVTEIKDNKKREVERKIYPGYVILKMIVTDESWYIVRNTRGVTGFVGSATDPVPLTTKEVEALGIGKTSIEVEYAVGDNVTITEGPLEGFVGIVDGIELEKNVVQLTISMFGRETPVELELEQVSKV